MNKVHNETCFILRFSTAKHYLKVMNLSKNLTKPLIWFPNNQLAKFKGWDKKNILCHWAGQPSFQLQLTMKTVAQ